MKRLLLLLALAAPALAAPAERAQAAASIYLAYALIAGTLVGWTVLVAALAPRRALRARVAQARRPWLCLLLGALQVLAVLLLLNVAERHKLLGLPALFGVAASFGQLTIGLAAFQSRLGQAVAHLGGRRLRPLGQILAGGVVLFLAGGFPYLGQALLVVIGLASLGSVPLGRAVRNETRPLNEVPPAET